MDEYFEKATMARIRDHILWNRMKERMERERRENLSDDELRARLRARLAQRKEQDDARGKGDPTS